MLVKGREGPIFDRIDLDVAVETDPGDEERARDLLVKAERQCIITRALHAPVHLTATVTAARAAS